MSWHELIFSDTPSKRWIRHGLFWVTWWFFFTGSYFNFLQPLSNSEATGGWSIPMFVKSLLVMLCHITVCYGFIYYLFPNFLLKGKWIRFAVGFLVVGLFTFLLTYITLTNFFPVLDELFTSPPIIGQESYSWTSFNIGVLSATKVIALAVTIKLLKRWWVKQQEKEKLEKEKINTELQLLKAQIHPGFLFNNLHFLYSLSLSGSQKTPETLLTLSDLLSYMLYDCDRALVPLEKEIAMMKSYIGLEKLRFETQLEVEIHSRGDAGNKMIAPFLLLPFIENSFRHCNNSMDERPWINLSLAVDDQSMFVKLVNSLSLGVSDESLMNVKTRLKILYPDNHRLKIKTAEGILVVSLRIPISKLHKSSAEKQMLEVAI